MLNLCKSGRLWALGLLCLIVAGCGSKEPKPPSRSDIQADMTRTQNDPNIPPMAKQQVMGQKAQLLRGSK